MKEAIKKGSWYKQAGNVKVYNILTPCKAAMHSLGGDLGFFVVTNRSYMEGFLPMKCFTEKSRNFLEQQKVDPSFIDREMEKSRKGAIPLEKYYKELETINFSELTLQQTKSTIQKLDKLNYIYWCPSYFCDWYDPAGDDMLKEEIQKEAITFTEQEITTLQKTNWKNYVQEERIDLLEISKITDAVEFNKRIEEHTNNFFYINNSWESTTVLEEDYFIKKSNEISNADDELEELRTNWDEEHKKIKEKYNISDEMMNVFYFFRQLFILRDDRKKHTLISNHYYDQLFNRLAQIHCIPFDDMKVIRIEDVGKTRKELMALIEKRRNVVMEIFTPKKITVLSGAEAVGVYNLLQKSYGSTGNLRGKGVCKGKVTGVARVLLGETHFSKFNEGEIIIAPMTRPEYVPLMEKALAIVTDEGGVTCHASIVSRELGIPCIVGTQKATTNIKDGMVIEVDADHGVIKVIRHLKLLSVQNLVEKELEKFPTLIEVLKEDLLNITAAAEKLKPSISEQAGKPVDTAAISMAIRRYAKKL